MVRSDFEWAVGVVERKLFMVVFTDRAGICRIISARRANMKEHRAYGPARITLDPNAPPKLSATNLERLDGMTEAEIAAAAEADLDNPPLSDAELGKVRSARIVRQARIQSGLSQAAFAKTYRINVARLRDLEQGRTQADSALLAYLTVIEKDPESVRRALGA
jgi:putative transcriptional regulator